MRFSSALARPLIVLATLALCACTRTHHVPATAVVVVIDAEAMVRADADRLIVQIDSGATPKDLEQRKEEIFDFNDDARWPVTLTLVADAGDSEPAFRVWARAQHDGDDIVDTRAISGFASGKALLLELLLSDGCIGMLDCDDDQTCVARDGRVECVDAGRDVAELGAFKPEDIKHLLDRDAGGARDSGSGMHGDRDGSAASDAAVREDAATSGDSGPQDAGGQDGGSIDSGSPTGGTGAPPPKDPELCFNGSDDDGDRKIDCADSDCTSTAVCVPAGDKHVVLLADPAAPCPTGYTETAVDVVRELRYSSACTGCNCSAAQAAECQAEIYFYDQGQCNVANNSGGVLVGYAVAACGVEPIGKEEGIYSPYGWRVGNVVPVTPATCNAGGSPTRPAPSWNQRGKLCLPTSTQTGGGCSANHVCVPKASAGTQCSQIPLAGTCSAGVSSDWYTGYDDQRACAPCGCSLVGGDCSTVTVRLGSDYSCGDFSGGHQLGPNQIACFAQSVYSPPVDIAGGPTTATCNPKSTAVGAVTPTGGARLCCN